MNNRKATVCDYARMCESFEYCLSCPLSKSNNGEKMSCMYLMRVNSDKASEIILKWCDENPIKTCKDDFFEKFPNARKTYNGYPMFMKCEIYGHKCNKGISLDRPMTADDCNSCWDMPMEE